MQESVQSLNVPVFCIRVYSPQPLYNPHPFTYTSKYSVFVVEVWCRAQ